MREKAQFICGNIIDCISIRLFSMVTHDFAMEKCLLFLSLSNPFAPISHASVLRLWPGEMDSLSSIHKSTKANICHTGVEDGASEHSLAEEGETFQFSRLRRLAPALPLLGLMHDACETIETVRTMLLQILQMNCTRNKDL